MRLPEGYDTLVGKRGASFPRSEPGRVYTS